jgi:DNA-binding NtrC family response regulator
MRIPALECVQRPTFGFLSPRELDVTRVLPPQSEGQPGLFLISEAHHTVVRDALPHRVDLGRKEPEIELARYFLRLANNEIGVLQGAYKSSGQLRRSARAVLSRLLDAGKHPVAFLVVPAPIFGKLWNETHESGPREDAAAESPVERVLRTLLPVPVPSLVRDSYVGTAPVVELVRQLVVLAAQHTLPVLIQGESGTGKEIVAWTIHQCSQQHGRGSDFRAVNCGAIPSDLLESELFGHAAGAFTDAREARAGLWESAGNGTLFLDEIAELTLSQQAKILRVLDTNEVRHVGADSDTKVQARVISATNRDLYAMVQRGAFREDLYYRLRVFRIPTPPLRDHPEDISVLAQWLWKKVAGETAPPLTSEIVDFLMEYTWPGNVRELKTVIASLSAWYGTRVSTREQAETIMYLVGQPTGFHTTPAPHVQSAAHQAGCLRHLRQVDEVLRATELLVAQPLSSRAQKSRAHSQLRAALTERHREIVELCQRPLLFSSHSAFEVVHSVSGKLAYLVELLQAEPEAIQSVRDPGLVRELQSARKLVLQELEELAPAPSTLRS